MKEPAAVTCARCGSAVSDSRLAGQCPRCLLRVARMPDDEPGELESGSRRFGEYFLERPMGTGGMGIVYEARRLSDPQRVAVKLIRDFHVSSPTQVRRFLLEAEAVARLDHPHIVRIHEVGEVDGQPFFSMDLIQGEDLNGWLAGAARGAQSGTAHGPRAVAALMAKVARAVHHAHQRGVLHRDLKPSNILVDDHGEPHLTDFGLAKLLQAGHEEPPPTLTGSGVPGTPSYMSPEQVRGGPVSWATDIYGLGAVLYALLTGQPPFAAANPVEVFQRILDRPPARPRSIRPDVCPDLETICLQCLEKAPRDRYPTAEALAEDLERAAAGQPIQARSVGPARRARQWIRRNPIGAGLIASLCLGLVVTLTLLKVVDDHRRAVELDRDEAFDEGMQKVSQIWQDPATTAVTISARELAILDGRSPLGLTRAAHQLTFGASASDKPASMAQRYAHLLGQLQDAMSARLGARVAFHLRLLKASRQAEEALARREVDLIVLSGVGFLHAHELAPNATAVALASTARTGILFVHTNSSARELSDLRNRSVVFPEPHLALTIHAKAQLLEAGLRAADLAGVTQVAEGGPDTGGAGVGTTEMIDLVLRGRSDAGVTRRGQFERYQHLGLRKLKEFPETPHVLAAREGLEPALVAALQEAMRAPETGASWPESNFVVAPLAADAKTAEAALNALEHAMDEAKQFDAR